MILQVFSNLNNSIRCCDTGFRKRSQILSPWTVCPLPAASSSNLKCSISLTPAQTHQSTSKAASPANTLCQGLQPAFLLHSDMQTGLHFLTAIFFKRYKGKICEDLCSERKHDVEKQAQNKQSDEKRSPKFTFLTNGFPRFGIARWISRVRASAYPINAAGRRGLGRPQRSPSYFKFIFPRPPGSRRAGG